MRQWILSAAVLGLALALVSVDADAKRVGGARSSGVQRQTPTQPMQKAPPQSQPDAVPHATPGAVPGAANAAAPGAAAAMAPAAAAKAAAPAAAAAQQATKRSWTGPLMGLAAGLGLAALFSHLGMGETFSSLLMLLLVGLVGFTLLRFFLRRRAAGAGDSSTDFTKGLATAGAGATGGHNNTPASVYERQASPGATDGAAPRSGLGGMSGIRIGSALEAASAHSPAAQGAAAQRYLPADFDSQAFERIAKTIFVRMQAANDERNVADLRQFTTPEMFAELQTDLLERGHAEQHTQVQSVNPTIVDYDQQGAQQIVSVRFVGVVRESGHSAESFDEIWHLVHDTTGGPGWRIAGIQQVA